MKASRAIGFEAILSPSRKASRRSTVTWPPAASRGPTSTMIGAAVGARLARRPLVWHVRESFWGAPRLWKLFGRFIRSMARVVVCNSAATASLAGLIPDRDCTVVYNGQVFEEADAPASLPPSVVAVGRINVWKGQDVLVDALGYLQRNGVTVAAELAGDVFPGTEHLREELETRIAGQGLTGQVRLLGYVDEVPALMRRHGIFVLPSKEAEGFGLALIEAMSLGLACVATAVGAPPEILTHGETGLLVPAGDPIALGEAIRTLIDDAELRLRLGRAAFTVARERFDAATMVDRIEALYEQALI